MKVFFYDGDLELECYDLYELICKTEGVDSTHNFKVVSAEWGPTANIEALKYISQHNNTANVLTNSILALNHTYAWDVENNRTNIYLYLKKSHQFKRIDELTDREIRYAHCIDKMYLAGSFDLEE